MTPTRKKKTLSMWNKLSTISAYVKAMPIFWTVVTSLLVWHGQWVTRNSATKAELAELRSRVDALPQEVASRVNAGNVGMVEDLRATLSELVRNELQDLMVEVRSNSADLSSIQARIERVEKALVRSGDLTPAEQRILVQLEEIQRQAATQRTLEQTKRSIESILERLQAPTKTNNNPPHWVLPRTVPNIP